MENRFISIWYLWNIFTSGLFQSFEAKELKMLSGLLLYSKVVCVRWSPFDREYRKYKSASNLLNGAQPSGQFVTENDVDIGSLRRMSSTEQETNEHLL